MKFLSALPILVSRWQRLNFSWRFLHDWSLLMRLAQGLQRLWVRRDAEDGTKAHQPRSLVRSDTRCHGHDGSPAKSLMSIATSAMVDAADVKPIHLATLARTFADFKNSSCATT